MFNWNEIYSMPYNASIDTTIQSFQYKLINRIIPTNKFLFKCKLVSSTLCDLCLSNEETITHMFWECPIIQDIWNNLNSFFQNNGITIELTLINVLFGISTNIHYKSINHIIMLMKMFFFTFLLLLYGIFNQFFIFLPHYFSISPPVYGASPG